nr:hypothetical protein [Tanacetum cinerariifolium]
MNVSRLTGGGRTRGRSCGQGDGRNDGLGGQVGGQGSEGDVKNATEGNDHRGCTHKEFLACNPEECDGKGGARVYTRWIEKMELVHDMSGCRDSQKVKYTAGLFVGHAAYTDRFHELSRLVPHLVSLEGKRIERNVDWCLGMLTLPMLETQLLEPVSSMGRGNQGNQARGRAFMLRAEEAHQDPNIVMDIKPSNLGFSYEIEIARGQLLEINKVIRGCKLEIEGHMFNINLIPFGSKSFDVIIGMDWLSDHKAEIICHEKVVRIPLLDGK